MRTHSPNESDPRTEHPSPRVSVRGIVRLQYEQVDPYALDRPQYALRVIAIVMVSVSYLANGGAPAVRFGMPVLFAIALLLSDVG